VLAEGVGLRFGVREQVVEVGVVGFRLHIADGRVLVEDGEVGSPGDGARRLVDEGQVRAQRAQQSLQRTVIGQLARCVGLLRHRLQLRQIALECLHAGESVPEWVGRFYAYRVGANGCSPLQRRSFPARAWERREKGAPPCAPTPLSHLVGEGLGVRAKNASASHAANPSGVPLSGGTQGVRAKLVARNDYFTSPSPNWRVQPRCVPVPLRVLGDDAPPPPAARVSLPESRA
jgi:hypothetical protein